ncbi:hypothetical protein K6119_12500 [Paracrocinitomix mangrovi]|uniref:hypothetical protein n=1 Tax=Paracrocinitomix mangrovi TaxID=2862509 RepID=UPI001C8D9FBC|nr:hypothetical protein [Paracrocinitomix mangrovi]UKN00551.1 hypothetical protein K6119_12500 [Paracrocinitomix mangrovi]
MENFLHAYFGWRFVFVFAYVLLFIWAIAASLYARIKNKKQKKEKFQFYNKWWYWTITLLLVLHILWIQIINPSYFGYGTPDYFSLIESRKDHLILYDYKYTEYTDEDGNLESSVPNLRLHVIDRNKHERVYWDLIGDNYNPIIYGNNVILEEKSDSKIKSISIFDVKKQKTLLLAKLQDTIPIGENEVEIYEITYDYLSYKIQTSVGDLYSLNKHNLKFEWYDSQNYRYPNDDSHFLLRSSMNTSDKQDLYLDDQLTPYEYLKGEIVNEHSLHDTDYALIHFQQDLDKTNPSLSLVNEYGQELWVKTLKDFRKDGDASGLKYIHRTLLSDSCCFVTSNEHIYEYDLRTGKLNWHISL